MTHRVDEDHLAPRLLDDEDLLARGTRVFVHFQRHPISPEKRGVHDRSVGVRTRFAQNVAQSPPNFLGLRLGVVELDLRVHAPAAFQVGSASTSLRGNAEVEEFLEECSRVTTLVHRTALPDVFLFFLYNYPANLVPEKETLQVQLQ